MQAHSLSQERQDSMRANGCGTVVEYRQDGKPAEQFYGLHNAERKQVRYIRACGAGEAQSFAGDGEVVLPQTFSIQPDA